MPLGAHLMSATGATRQLDAERANFRIAQVIRPQSAPGRAAAVFRKRRFACASAARLSLKPITLLFYGQLGQEPSPRKPPVALCGVHRHTQDRSEEHTSELQSRQYLV